MKKIFALLLALLLLSSALALPAAAGPVPIWLGVHATGVIPLYETPIAVTGARLTFDLAEFPEDYYREKDAYLAYAGKVTTEYTFYNPTAETVTATLVFPFGRQPDYMGVYGEDGNYDTAADAEKYRITVDGEAVKTAIRYTCEADLQFDLERDLARLLDTYITDDFFTPETAVTKYTYTVGGANKEGQIDEEAYPSAYAAFSYASNGETRFLCGSAGRKGGNSLAAVQVENGEVITVYAIGTPKEPTWTCYANAAFEDKNIIDGTVALTATESMTLEEFVLAAWSAESGIWQVDWYNAIINILQSNTEDGTFFGYTGFGVAWDSIPRAEQYGKYLQRWHEYQITLASGERVACAVEAPVYPMANRYYEPYIYTYTYQCSSFASWANFGALEVAVNTPFYMTASVTEGFEKSENGYALTFTGAPETDLTFTLSSSQNPVFASAHTPASVLTLVAVAALGIALVTVPIVFLVKGWGKKGK